MAENISKKKLGLNNGILLARYARNGLSVDKLLGKGSVNATPIQRTGAGIFAIAFFHPCGVLWSTPLS